MPLTTPPMLKNQDLIVFSHLRWEFVKQRPQHLIERLARHNRVLFVEEPIAPSPSSTGRATARVLSLSPNLRVLQPRGAWGEWAVLSQVISRHSHLQSQRPLVWLYSASYLPILDDLDYQLLIYDCMDELSAFKGAPPRLQQQERQLLATADLVFTGGRSLYQAKRLANPQTYCFPSSVDQRHFRQATSRLTRVPADLAVIPGPRVGFYGVLDERLDLALLAQVAALLPTISLVLIGPVVKIDPAELPQAPNLHYLGARDYAQLPAYLKGMAVAMMPFALNQATRFISPTKTLEFMAAGKPIVSTAIRDVADQYRQEVNVVHSAAEFAQAVTAALDESSWARQLRLARQAAVLQRTSWDRTAAAMQQLIATQLAALAQPATLDTVEAPSLPARLQVAV